MGRAAAERARVFETSAVVHRIARVYADLVAERTGAVA
jgi:hypothetical protein